MTFITQGKTNWKYLSIIFILALLVGVFSFISKDYEKREEVKEIDSSMVYKNKEIGIEFNYPEWGSLSESFNEEQLEVGIYHFIPEEEKIKKIWYHQPSGMLAFVEKGEEYESLFDLGKVDQEILKTINSNGEIIEVYTFLPEQVSLHYSFAEISFSPNGRYINIIVTLARDRGPVLFDIESEDVIFGEFIKPNMQEIFYYNPYKDIYWSEDSKVFAARSYVQPKGGARSKDGLFVSDYNDIRKIDKVFSSIDKHELNPMMGYSLYDLVDIYFEGNQILFFTEKSEELNEETRYQYYLERKELEIKEEGRLTEDPYIMGEIHSISENRILVAEESRGKEYTGDINELKGNAIWVTIKEETQLLDSGKNSLELKDLEIGMEVEVWVKGFILESYPARATGFKILVLERNKLSKSCFVGGCSGELCTEDPEAISTCEFLLGMECLGEEMSCESINGRCTWVLSQKAAQCFLQVESQYGRKVRETRIGHLFEKADEVNKIKDI